MVVLVETTSVVECKALENHIQTLALPYLKRKKGI